MTDLLSEGLQWLADELLAHAAKPIRYVRDETETATEAIIGKLETRTIDTNDATLAVTGRTFLIPLAAVPEPRRGDIIIYRLPDGHDAYYTVTGYPPAEPTSTGFWRIPTAYDHTT